MRMVMRHIVLPETERDDDGTLAAAESRYLVLGLAGGRGGAVGIPFELAVGSRKSNRISRLSSVPSVSAQKSDEIEPNDARELRVG